MREAFSQLAVPRLEVKTTPGHLTSKCAAVFIHRCLKFLRANARLTAPMQHITTPLLTFKSNKLWSVLFDTLARQCAPDQQAIAIIVVVFRYRPHNWIKHSSVNFRGVRVRVEVVALVAVDHYDPNRHAYTVSPLDMDIKGFRPPLPIR